MKIYRISALSTDIEGVYDELKEALAQLNLNHIGVAKNKIKNIIKKMEKIRPHLRDKDKPTRSGFKRKSK